jgi:predicted nucleotide-binding protein
LAEAIETDHALARYMQLSFDHFHQDGTWPNIERLQKRLLRDGDPIDLYSIGARIPSELGTDPTRVENRCYLTVPAIALCKGSEEEIADFLMVLKLAVERYLAEESDDAETRPAITSIELAQSMGLSELRLRRVHEMTEWAPFLAGGGQTTDGAWQRYVQPATRHFIKVKTIKDYVNAFGAMRSPYRRSMFAPLRTGQPTGFSAPELEAESTPELTQAGGSAATPSGQPDPRRVFVVHGRNLAARDAMFAFLRAVGLQPIEWSQAVAMTGEASPYVGTILDAAFGAAQAIVVLLTPDEVTYLRSEYSDEDDPETRPAPQARPNVLFEAGMAMGRDAKRTVLVQFGQMRPFTDVVGRHAVRIENSVAMRKELAQRLATTGCMVDLSGDSWLSAGDFTPPAEPGGGLPLGKRVPELPSRRRVAIDLRYHDRGNGDGRLEIVNRGTETVFDLNLRFPPEAAQFEVMTANELPLTKLPPGKSVSLIALNLMGGGGRSHFDVKVTGRMADGTEVSEDVFLSLR